jgi:putative hydrolase of the HAD superfamily
MPQIKNIVFDIGKVLIDFDYTSLLAFLNDHGIEYEDKADLMLKMELVRYERGEMSSDEFLANLNGLLKRPAHRDELFNLWTQIFFPVPEMLAAAEQLMVTHRVYLLSNNSDLHWEYLKQKFQIHELARGTIVSHEVGARKPDPEIYRIAEREFSLRPTETVFIDDMQENAAGAERCGWHAIHHQSPRATLDSLQALSVEIGD